MSSVGSMSPRKDSTPCFAIASFWPVIEPLRSSTTITSSGRAPHGEQAWA